MFGMSLMENSGMEPLDNGEHAMNIAVDSVSQRQPFSFFPMNEQSYGLTSVDTCKCRSTCVYRPTRIFGDLSLGSVLGRGLAQVTVGH